MTEYKQRRGRPRLFYLTAYIYSKVHNSNSKMFGVFYRLVETNRRSLTFTVSGGILILDDMEMVVKATPHNQRLTPLCSVA